MRHGVRVLCGPEVASGFALAGLATIEAITAEEGAHRLADLGAEPGVGIVLVQSSLYDAMPEETRRSLGGRPLPMIIPFPAPRWTEGRDAAEDYIVEILRQAIGYRVRLR